MKSQLTRWRVFCRTGECRWRVRDLTSRESARAAGRAHIADDHGRAAEWEFQVQGYRPPERRAEVAS